MSMFMVPKAHIDVMTTALLRSELVPEIGGLAPSTVGMGLWLENWNSGRYRYPQAWGQDPDSYENLAVVQAYQHEPQPLPDLSNVQAQRALTVVFECYSYQACEHPTWERSPYCRWVRAMLAALPDSKGVDAHGLGVWPVPSAESWARTVGQLDGVGAGR